MDIGQLRTLIHVAEIGSLSRAADRLGIAQPALSRRIRLLEEELGTPLFIRHGRGMTLTDAGRAALVPANVILDRLDEIHSVCRRAPAAIVGRVRLGMTPTVAEIMTVPLASGIRAAHPGISLSVSTGFSGHLLDWLKRGEIDCCIAYDAQDSATVRTRPLLRETLMLVRSGRREAPEAPLRIADLVDMPLVLPSLRHGLRIIVDRCADQAGIALTPAIEADSFAAMIDLVRNGFGATILPLAPIFQHVRAGQLHTISLIDPVPTRLVVMAKSSDRPLGPAAQAVAETFTTITERLVTERIWAGTIASSV